MSKISETNDYISPDNLVQDFAKDMMPKKAGFGKIKTMILAILGGSLVSFGAQVSLCTMCGTESVLGWGLARLIGAIMFSTGLMMVVLTGAELFTGNIMMVFSVIKKKTTVRKLLRNWTIVYIGNFIGCLIIAFLVYQSGIAFSADNELGILGLKTAINKTNLTFAEAFSRGILCNWLVCLAIWMASCTKYVIGKIFAVLFPISTFIACGFDNSIANMYFLANGLLIKRIPEIVAESEIASQAILNLSWQSSIFNNLIPVTLGNIVGAIVFVVLIFWAAYIRVDQKGTGSLDIKNLSKKLRRKNKIK